MAPITQIIKQAKSVSDCSPNFDDKKYINKNPKTIAIEIKSELFITKIIKLKS